MYQGQEVRTHIAGLSGMAGKVTIPGEEYSTVVFKPVEDTGFAKTIRNEYLIPVKEKSIFDEAREAIDNLERVSKYTPQRIHVEIGRNVYIVKSWLPKKEL